MSGSGGTGGTDGTDDGAAHAAQDGANVRARAVSGTVLTLSGQVVTQGLRLASNLVLTRLLWPELFGLMALVNVVVAGLQMISDVGSIQSVITHKRGDEPAFLHTAFTIQALRGVALFVGGSLIAYPYAILYGEPRLAVLMPVTLVAALVSGLDSMAMAQHLRHIRLLRPLLIDVAAQVSTIVLMVGVAWWTRSVWALVVGAVASPLVRMLLTHVALPGPRMRFAIDKTAASEIVHLGKWIFLSTLITFAALRLDVFLLGKLVPLERLGVYSIATMLAALPMTVAGQVTGQVLMPALSASYRETPEAFARAFAGARGVLLPALAFVVLSATLLSPPFFQLLYDDRYVDAGWMVQLLMAASWFFCLQDASNRALLATGESRTLAVANAVKLVVTALGAFAGWRLLGLPGFIIGGSLLGSLAGNLIVGLRLEQVGVKVVRVDVGWSLALGALSAAVLWVTERVAGVAGLPAWATSTAVALLVLVPAGLWVARRVVRAMRAARATSAA